MKKSIAVLAVTGAGYLAAAQPATAATEIYMQVTAEPPITGEVTVKNYVGQIQLLSYSQSVQAVASQATGSGASAGKPSCGPITLTKHVDKSSPLLIGAVMTGERIPQAVISFVDTQNANGRSAQRNDYTITLTEVMLTSVQQSDASPAELTESVSLIAARFAIDYVPFSPTGAAGNHVKVEVDCAANVVN
jgi:type VI secretion system secreted protein Hcp